MKKLTVHFFAILAVLLVFKAGCSDINRSGIQDEVDGIKAVVPAQGPYGARVLIEGKGFTNNPSVLFNGVEAMIETANDSSILTRVPYEATTGPLEVVAGQALFTGPNFSIDSTRTLFLVIDEIRPATARYRDTVYIAGTGFDPVPDVNEVYFNDLRAEVTEAEDTVLVTTVPFGAESGLISVVANQDTAIGPEFTLLRHQISELDPSSGRVGTQVRISGTNFSGQMSENSVFFNGIQAEVLESSTDQLIASVPFEATTGPVSVAVRRDTVEGPTFSVQELQILEVAPLSGEVGTEVLISGNGFSPVVEENTIQFNGVSAPVLSASETELQTRVPEGATNGNITVSVNGMSVTGPEFMVEQGAPVIASVDPQSGLIGDDVTITGSNFRADTAEVSVLFNEVEAEILSSTETEIQTRVPQGATNGPITVSVNGKSATGPDFEVITTGTLIVEITTTGADVDTDGYTLTINAGDAIRTDVNDTITRSGLEEGEYEVLLGDIETNCYLTQDLPNPRTAFVEAGATTRVNYVITCEGVNEPPVAAFATACNGLTCDLDASGSSDPDGSITAFDWILGDGSTATGEVVSHTYETSGIYSIELTVTDNENATHSVTQDVTVTVPEITEVSPLSGVPGSTVLISGANFSATASENNVQFNGVRAELNSASETELSAIVPGDATTGPITVTVNGYTAQGPEFTVEAVQQPKSLQVVTSTQGSMQDEDGYTLSVSGQDDRIVKPTDNVTYSNILENSVQVELTGVADNCVVEGDNPRSVNLDNSDNWGYTEFTVTCSAPAPEITSIDPTSGPTGTEVTITGSNFSAVASENNVQFNGERAELNSASETQLVAIVPGLATSGPVTVEVNGQTATGPEFTVIVPKTLYVNAETTNPVSDSYTVLVSGFDNRQLPVNGGIIYENILSGQVDVELTDYPSGCSLIAGENPRTISFDNGYNEATTNFYLDCSPPAPTIESINPTSGIYGSSVTITGTNFSTVNMENDVRFNGTRAELNFVSATEIEAIVPWNATSGPVTVTVGGQTATGPNFNVVTTGSVEVNVKTTGTNIDPNGYQLFFDKERPTAINVNDQYVYTNVEAGPHTLEITDIASNCMIKSGPENPYSLYVESGATLILNYELYCEGSASPEKILFHGGDKSTDIFMMDPDGANVIQLTNDAFLNINPVASYAGDKIAYVGGSDIKGIRLMDYDGTNQQPITGSELMNPIILSWSPKDDAILFSEDNAKTLDLYVIGSNGSGLNQVTNTTTLDEVYPHWSPSGNEIIFVQIDPEIAGSGTIMLANPDGTNQRKITEISGDYSYPRISPDGSRIAYVHMAGDCDQIFTMDLDGNNISPLTAETEFKCDNIDGLDWSPDGTQIVFQTNQGAPGTSRMWVIPSNGSTSPYVITNTSDHPSELALPTWGNYKQ